MKTNILKYTAVSLFAAVLLSGCLKLDQLPTDKFTDDVFWSSPERAQTVLNMAYNQMYNHDWMWHDECLSDNLIGTSATDGMTTIRRGGATPSTEHFEKQWKAIFEGIKTCNVFMAKVDLVPNMDIPLKNRMKAEIRFIRASLYFRAVNFWGDMPFFLRDITVVEARQMTRTPKAEIMAGLHRELDEIMDQLPLRDDLQETENGRITRGACAMLKIRFFLMEKNFAGMAGVESWCRRFIDGEFGTYSLFTGNSPNYSAYESLFHSAHEYNSEVILDYSAMEEVKEWNLVSMTPQTLQGRVLTSRTPSQSLVDSYITLNGLPVKGAVTNPVPYSSDPGYSEANPYVNRDLRLDATVVYHGFLWKDKDDATKAYKTQTIYIRPGSAPNGDSGFAGKMNENEFQKDAATKTGYYLRKYFDPDHRTEQRMFNNKILMRYADVLLMYAEACIENGTFSESVWNETVRPLRARAGFTRNEALNMPAGLNENQYKEIVRRERRCELAMEGLRYFDIIRWGEGPSLLSGKVYGARMLVNNTQYIEVDNWKFTAGRDELWSLPFYEMDKAPGLKPNNPNY